MDWYKIFEVATPSIITGATIVIGAYLGYFKKKFEKYGEIAAQTEKIDEILALEKAKINEKNSNEFQYQKRKDDSDRLINFGKNILKSHDLNKKADNDLIASINKSIKNLQPHGSIDVKGYAQNNELHSLFRQVEMEHIVYFKEYDETFNKKFKIWCDYMRGLAKERLDFLTIILFVIKENKNPNFTTNETVTKIEELCTQYFMKTEYVNQSNKHNELIDSFEKLSNSIRNRHFA